MKKLAISFISAVFFVGISAAGVYAVKAADVPFVDDYGRPIETGTTTPATTPATSPSPATTVQNPTQAANPAATTQTSGTAQVGKAPTWLGIVPCGRNVAQSGENVPCTLCHFVIGFQRLFQYGLYIVITIAFVAIFFAGVMYMVSSGDETMMTSAKSFLKSALIGFFLVLGAWLIVNTTLWVLGDKSLSSWSNFSCSTASTATGGAPAATTAKPTSTTTPPAPSSSTTVDPYEGIKAMN